MVRMRLVVAVALAAVVAAAGPAGAEGPAPVGSVVAVTGSVQLGRDGVWQPAAEKQPLFEGQTIRTGAGSGVRVLFGADVAAALGEKAEMAVADLLLKAQLERARAKIAAPADSGKAELQVTPLTGVRGTERTEEKAGDLKREHYWNESAPAAK